MKWDELMDITFVANFDLIRSSHGDANILVKPWIVQANCNKAIETVEPHLAACQSAYKWTKHTAAIHYKNCCRVTGFHETQDIFGQGQTAYWAVMENKTALIFFGK